MYPGFRKQADSDEHPGDPEKADPSVPPSGYLMADGQGKILQPIFRNPGGRAGSGGQQDVRIPEG